MLKKLVHSLQFIQAYARLVHDPNRLDLVFAVVDRTVESHSELPAALRRPEVLEFLSRPRQPLDIDIHVLGMLPEGTLGREVADWFERRGLTPDALARHLEGGDMARFKEHMTRTHDIWHVVTGFDTDVAGELGLQAFYLAQFNSPVAMVLLSAAFLNTFLREREDAARRMDQVTRGWELGKAAKPLVGTDWAALWEKPLTEVRHRFGIHTEAAAEAA